MSVFSGCSQVILWCEICVPKRHCVLQNCAVKTTGLIGKIKLGV